MEKIKQRKSETTVRRNIPRFNLFRRIVSSSSSGKQLTMSAHSSNVVLNIEKMGTDQYYTFHQEHHSKKTFPQWNQSMRMVSTQHVYPVTDGEENEPIE